jgi:hypothetical protein
LDILCQSGVCSRRCRVRMVRCGCVFPRCVKEPNRALHLTPAAFRFCGVYGSLAAGAGELCEH